MLHRYSLLSSLLLEFKIFMRIVKINNWVCITNFFLFCANPKSEILLTHIKYYDVEIQKKDSAAQVLLKTFIICCVLCPYFAVFKTTR